MLLHRVLCAAVSQHTVEGAAGETVHRTEVQFTKFVCVWPWRLQVATPAPAAPAKQSPLKQLCGGHQSITSRTNNLYWEHNMFISYNKSASRPKCNISKKYF